MNISKRKGFTVRVEPTEEELSLLREKARPFYTEKRFAHALAVEREADYLASFVCPEHVKEARAASILHDIAKNLCYEKQLNYIREFGIIDCNKFPDPPLPAVAHAAAGAAVTMAFFPEYAADEELLSAIKYHTTGRAGMTVLEAVVFLADYIEPTRTYDKCLSLRASTHAELERAADNDGRLEALRRAVCKALSDTVSYVKERGGKLEVETAEALSYFEGGGTFGEGRL